MLKWFFKGYLNLSARGGLTRYMVESLVSPTLYSSIKNNQTWEDLLLSLVKTSTSPPKIILEQMERNIRFRANARRRYFSNHYAAPINAKSLLLRDPAPTRAQVLSIFPEVSRFIFHGNENSKRSELVQFAKTCQTGSELSHWDIHDLLEAVGCCTYGSSSFNTFCEREGVYDLFTEEYLTSLATHLKRKKFIVEVGAGSGRLSALLRTKLPKTTCTIVATDSGRWRKMPGLKPTKDYPVEMLDYQEALVKYPQTDTILCSWMPMGQDWTSSFRSHANVSEYILIGEPGCCGKAKESWEEKPFEMDPLATFLPAELLSKDDPWSIDVFEWLGKETPLLSWNEDLNSKKEEVHSTPPPTPPLFEKRVLPCSKFQLSRYDRRVRGGNSQTVSFARNAYDYRNTVKS